MVTTLQEAEHNGDELWTYGPGSHAEEVDDIGRHLSSSFLDSAGCLKLLFL